MVRNLNEAISVSNIKILHSSCLPILSYHSSAQNKWMVAHSCVLLLQKKKKKGRQELKLDFREGGKSFVFVYQLWEGYKSRSPQSVGEIFSFQFSASLSASVVIKVHKFEWVAKCGIYLCCFGSRQPASLIVCMNSIN